MGTLSSDHEEPAFWDGQRERRIFLEYGDLGWGVYWMRGYCGENTKNRFKSIPMMHEKMAVETHLRRMAKEKGWSEMKRCARCDLLYHGCAPICHVCQYYPPEAEG